MKPRTALIVGTVAALVAAIGLSLVLLRPSDRGVATELDVTVAPEEWLGVEWIEVTNDAPNGPSWSSIYDARRFGDQVLAAGYAVGPDGQDATLSSIWRSHDGVAWTAQAVSLDGETGFVPSAVALGPAGLLSAGYSERDKGMVLAGSADGALWTELARPTTGIDMHLVIGTEAGYVTGGYANERPTAWKTRDGRDWTEVPIPDVVESTLLNDLVAGPQGVHLAGLITAPGTLRPLLWRLDDDAWASLELPLGNVPAADWAATVDDLVLFNGGVFAVGRAGPTERCPTTEGHIASVAIDPSTTADTTSWPPCPWPPPASWVSVDGVTWQQASLPIIAGVDPDDAVFSVASGGAGLIALVYEGSQADVVGWGLWTSADGSAWARIGDGMPLDRGSYYHRFVAMSGRVVVLGDDGQGRPLAWVGLPAR